MKGKNSPLFLGIIVIFVITVGIALYSGKLWGRWGAFPGLEVARETMKNLPMEIGDWQAEKENELDSASITMLRIQDSYIFRSYRNTSTQSVVRLTMMVGHTGKITVHTPEVCFGGKDYEKEAVRSSVPITVRLPSGDKEVLDTFWMVNFVGRSLDTNNRISFYYAVSLGDVWNAVENPRIAFVKYRYVYKIQVEAYSGAGDDEDNVKKFLVECLPTIHEHMRPYGQ